MAKILGKNTRLGSSTSKQRQTSYKHMCGNEWFFSSTEKSYSTIPELCNALMTTDLTHLQFNNSSGHIVYQVTQFTTNVKIPST